MNAKGERDPFGAVLLHLINNTRDLCREDVAMVGGVDQSMVSRYLSGQHPVPLALAVGLARIGFSELLAEACQRAGGRFVLGEEHSHKPVGSARQALGVTSELATVVSAYVAELAEASKDDIVTPSEHRTLQHRARAARAVLEDLERGHRTQSEH